MLTPCENTEEEITIARRRLHVDQKMRKEMPSAATGARDDRDARVLYPEADARIR